MLILGIAFWTVIAVQSVMWRYYWTQAAPRPLPLDFIIRAELLMFGIAGLLTPAVVAAVRWMPARGSRRLVWLGTHLLLAACYALLVKMAWDVAMLPMYTTPWVAQFSWGAFRNSLLAGAQVNFMLYWVVLAGITALDEAARYRNAAIEAAELRAQLAEAQLQSLRIQLDPHFLFNTLNSISGLVQQDPETAEQMIADLSELLRRSLAHRQRAEVRLAEELEFVRLYLDIQKRRFDERLQVRYEVDADTQGALVPTAEGLLVRIGLPLRREVAFAD